MLEAVVVKNKVPLRERELRIERTLGVSRSRETRLCEGINTVEELKSKRKGKRGREREKSGLGWGRKKKIGLRRWDLDTLNR